MIKSVAVQKIDAIFNKVIHQESDEWNLNINLWSWSCGVGMYGIMKASEVTGDTRYKSFMEKWFEDNHNNHLFGSVNNVAPVSAVLFLAEKSREEKYLAVCREYSDWCMYKALRTCNGGLAHVWQGGDEDYKNQLWIDTIFMSGIFMVKYGLYIKDESIIREGIKQLDLHIDCLIDQENDLFYHAYHCIDNKHLGQHWGRGNGWMVGSLVEVIEVLRESGYEISRYAEILGKVMEKAYSVKVENGMLRTLPLVGESYIETTATSLFGYAALKGFRVGILDRKFADWGCRIVKTVIGLISDDGRIEHCSYGTNPETKEVYMTRPCDQSLYADGIVMMLLAESNF